MFQLGDIVTSAQNSTELYEIISISDNLATIRSVKYKTDYPHIPLRILILKSRSKSKTNSFQCVFCKMVKPVNEKDTRTESSVCVTCFPLYYAECAVCNKYHGTNVMYGRNVLRRGIIRICKTCLDTFDSCENCGIYITKEVPKNRFCPACKERNDHPEAAGARRSFDYVPEFKFLKTKEDSDNPVYLGIELECANIENIRDNDVVSYEITKKSNTSLYCVFDSSINASAPGQRNGNGIEIVSHPATWLWWKSNKEIVAMMMSIRDQGFRSYNAKLCGMHIHISKKAFTREHLASFLLLFFEEAKFWSILSEKTTPELNRYASFRSGVTDYTDIAGLLLKSNTRDILGSRYKVVNVTSHTVEVRHLRGALDENYFYKNLELIIAAFEFTKTERIPSDKKFLDFVHSNRKTYPLLYRFLMSKLEKQPGYLKHVKGLTKESVSPIVLHPCA